MWRERKFSYEGLTADEAVEHLAEFISGIWQIHPFPEGNTRTTAVFAVRYLRHLGFTVHSEAFAESSKYFRDALVRANYTNFRKGVESDMSFLILFLLCLMSGRGMSSGAAISSFRHEDMSLNTEQVPDKYRTSCRFRMPLLKEPAAEPCHQHPNVVK